MIQHPIVRILTSVSRATARFTVVGTPCVSMVLATLAAPVIPATPISRPLMGVLMLMSVKKEVIFVELMEIASIQLAAISVAVMLVMLKALGVVVLI